jgi:hypothetical protein
VYRCCLLLLLVGAFALQFLEKAAAVCLAIRGVAIATNLISATSLVRFLRKRKRAKDKKQNMWERLTRAP